MIAHSMVDCLEAVTCSRRAFLTAAGALSLSSYGAPAIAQGSFASKPLRIIVPFAPGGSADLLARLLAPKMGSVLGQPAVVENKGGAGGALGAQAGMRADPDGHTLLFHSTTLIISGLLNKKSGYDVRRDFVPVSLLTEAPLVLEIHPSVPAKTLPEFLEYAKSKGSDLFFGSAGIGSTQHLFGELFNIMAGTKMKHVPYKGNGPATGALLGGEVQVMFDIIPLARQLGETGKVRLLGVTSPKRSPSLPKVPTVDEAGVPGFRHTFWQRIFLPKGTPAPIVQQWQAAAKQALAEPQAQAWLADQGYTVIASSPSELAQVMQRDLTQWGKVIADAGIQSE